MYRIIGADQKEYGPVSADQIRQWIAEGRANGQTRVQAEGRADWQTLSTFPEFAEVLAAQGSVRPPPVAEGRTGTKWPAEILAGDYNLDIGGCISNGWQLFKSHFSVLFLGALICLL